MTGSVEIDVGRVRRCPGQSGQVRAADASEDRYDELPFLERRYAVAGYWWLLLRIKFETGVENEEYSLNKN